MANESKFIIHNDLAGPMTLNIEPEGTFLTLDEGQAVSVTDLFTVAPVTLKLSRDAGGGTILSIWPGDGSVVVEKDGVDLLDRLGTIPDPLGSQA